MLHSAGWAKGLEEALAVFSMLVLMIQQRADPFELWPSSGWELKGVTPKFLSKAVNCYALCSAGLLLDGKPLGQHHSHFRQTEVSPHCQTLTNWLKLVQNQFIQKWKFYHLLLTPVSFQTCMTDFQAERKSNVTLFHAATIDGDWS